MEEEVSRHAGVPSCQGVGAVRLQHCRFVSFVSIHLSSITNAPALRYIIAPFALLSAGVAAASVRDQVAGGRALSRHGRCL